MTLILSGTDGLSDVDGSAATPAIRGTDANTGIFFPAADTIGFAEGGVEAMRIDSSGNVGIGTSSIFSGLRVNVPYSVDTDGAASKWTARFSDSSAVAINVGGSLLFQGTRSSAGAVGNFAGIAGRKENATDNNEQGYLGFFTTPSTGVITERMRIDSSGNLLVGTTSLSTITGETAAKAQVAGNFIVGNAVAATNVTATINGVVSKAGRIAFAESGAIKWLIGNGAASENGVFQVYDNVNGTGVQLARGGTSWTAISDEREKDIIESISDAANKVATLRAVIGKYKTDEIGTRRSFLIAQDVQAVLPEAIDNTNPDKLGVRYTEVIPLLVAAIKEQQAIITQLQADVAALKGTP